MPYGDQVSRHQQPQTGGGPPSLEAQRRMTEEWMEKNLGSPRTPSTAEETIRQSAQQMRSGQGMWPVPRKEGPVPRPEHERDAEMSLGLDPLDWLNQSRFRQRLNFPEVFGGASPDFLQGNPIDDQKMLWEAQMSDSPRDEQLPWNSDLPPWNVGR